VLQLLDRHRGGALDRVQIAWRERIAPAVKDHARHFARKRSGRRGGPSRSAVNANDSASHGAIVVSSLDLRYPTFRACRLRFPFSGFVRLFCPAARQNAALSDHA
jgi:hypothetical protein